LDGHHLSESPSGISKRNLQGRGLCGHQRGGGGGGVAFSSAAAGAVPDGSWPELTAAAVSAARPARSRGSTVRKPRLIQESMPPSIITAFSKPEEVNTAI